MPYKIQSSTCKFPGLTNYSVHILNNLPKDSKDALEIHCASGDNDLGHKFPPVGSDFNWGFCGLSNTLFFCHFWWGNYNQVFDVFNDLTHCVHDAFNFIPSGITKCIWQVNFDGIYLGFLDGDQLHLQRYREW
ncbi:unnamed protein product [Withania somnifera]